MKKKNNLMREDRQDLHSWVMSQHSPGAQILVQAETLEQTFSEKAEQGAENQRQKQPDSERQ